MENHAETLNNPESPSPEDHTRQVGATALTTAGFNTRHKDIVESSFNKAKDRGEKLPGKNNERRNYAYLSRLERLISKYGNSAEQKLWQKSINDDLLIKYENITDSYWQSKQQELRDNGHGNVQLTEEYKHAIYDEERKLQKESLESWANYLGDEHSPYPLWFKVYAWDGMTKMGRYDKSKGKYATRDETTVAPYPDADAEILSGVFEVVNRYYGNHEREFYTEEGERNIELEKDVSSGNFARIYNAIQQDVCPIIEPPENPEDVHGVWREYALGDEQDIARAAKGTGWCVATPAVGRHYLEYGTYGQDNDWDDDHDDNESSKAKFILFHLEDPTTGKLSKNAVASIRLDPDGQVAEISGIKKGQALNDSVVSTVEAKVKTLPGGEEFLPKFADKNELIRLDRKMQNGEDLTKEELEFIYEIHHPIKTLDTYNDNDPRITELREKYGIEYALNAGVDIDQLVSELDSYQIADNLDTLINHGANIDIDHLVSRLGPYGIAYYLDTFINHGANIDQLVSQLDPDNIANNLDTLINHGADIDVNDLVSELDSRDIANNLDTLINHGADIDVNHLVSQLKPYDIVKNLDTLINRGVNINYLVSQFDSRDIAYNLDALINYGANIDIDHLVSQLGLSTIAYNLDTLINHGADIDVNHLVSQLKPHDIAAKLDTLINHGADINHLVSRLYPDTIAKNLDTLINYGADINLDKLASELSKSCNKDNVIFNNLRRHGWQG